MNRVNPVEHPDTFDSFSKWLDVFRSRNGGWYPADIKGWFDRVNNSHEFLRGKLGGIRKEYNLKLKSQQKPISMSDAKPYIDEILGIATGYLEHNGVTSDVFLQPTRQKGTHQVIRVGKDVRSYADNIVRYQPNRLTQLKKIDTALAKLGELWSRAKTSDVDLEATISTSPRSFILLGHYGPDQDSCWRQGSDKTKDKYVLGQSPHTFTITISCEKDNKRKNVARCFGWTNERFEVINTANYYLADKFPEGDGIEMIKSIFKDLFQDDLEMHEDQQYIPIGSDQKGLVFHNPYGRWSFSKGKGSILRNSSDIEFHPVLDMVKRFRCPRCRKDHGSNDKGWEFVDEQYVCINCTDEAYRCELTASLTFNPLIEYISIDNDRLMVKETAVQDAYTCSMCNVRHAVQMHTPDKKSVCLECFEANYEECSSCHNIVTNDEMCDIGEMDICKVCLENGVSPFGEDETDAFVNIMDGRWVNDKND